MHHVRTKARERGSGRWARGGALTERDEPISWGLAVETMDWQEEVLIRR